MSDCPCHGVANVGKFCKGCGRCYWCCVCHADLAKCREEYKRLCESFANVGERYTQLEVDRDKWKESSDYWVEETRKRVKRIHQLEAERSGDRLCVDEYRKRITELEKERDRYREALEKLAEEGLYPKNTDAYNKLIWVQSVAQSALKEPS